MQYDKEFKLQALELSDEIGVKAAADQLGIKYYTLADCHLVEIHSLPQSHQKAHTC